MEWLKSNTFFQKTVKSVINTEECDPQACYDSFKGHWDQAKKIIQRVQQLPSHDDVLGVVNHLEQMVTLLIYDMKKCDGLYLNLALSKCLEYLLTENVLDKLFEWGTKSGKYTNAVRCEQLKLYNTLISESRHLLLKHNSFLKPLIKLLDSCIGDMFSKELEKILVDLLNQLSALLVQHPEYANLFFVQDKNINRFTIFSLLIPFVHKDNSIGMRARDALLLCMSLSKKNRDVQIYISEHSNFSILVASGLSGLYSVLPNIIDDIAVPDWHQFTPDDVNEIVGLLSFVTSLEFSNAIAQVAHKTIRRQLQDFLYRGFLIPVLGAALLQDNIQEQVAATAYLELIIRTVTEPGLLHAVLKFLLKDEYDGKKLLNILIERLDSERQLCLVSMAVFESMLDLNCEDILLELVFQYLQPCFHLMVSQRNMLLPLDPLCPTFEKFLLLAPNCCRLLSDELEIDEHVQWNHFKHKQSLYGKYYSYLCDARNKIAQCQKACASWNNSYNGDDEVNIHTDEKPDSLVSLERSSGYESFNFIPDEAREEEYWQISSSKVRRQNPDFTLNDTSHLDGSPNAGPFLTILLQKLRNFLSNSIYVNLHLTGLISRLAVYPQTLLRAYLLDHSLVLQPNVPSIFEIIGILKQQIDDYISKQPNGAELIKYAQDVLVEREIMLVNIRRPHLDKPLPKPVDSAEPFQRNAPKRRSLNIPSLSSMFSRRPSQVDSSLPVIVSCQELQYNQIYPKFNEGQHVALCAILLDEWVKELASLAQEHTIAQLASLLN